MTGEKAQNGDAADGDVGLQVADVQVLEERAVGQGRVLRRCRRGRTQERAVAIVDQVDDRVAQGFAGGRMVQQ